MLTVVLAARLGVDWYEKMIERSKWVLFTHKATGEKSSMQVLSFLNC